jgi:hypothetical protein
MRKNQRKLEKREAKNREAQAKKEFEALLGQARHNKELIINPLHNFLSIKTKAYFMKHPSFLTQKQLEQERLQEIAQKNKEAAAKNVEKKESKEVAIKNQKQAAIIIPSKPAYYKPLHLISASALSSELDNTQEPYNAKYCLSTPTYQRQPFKTKDTFILSYEYDALVRDSYIFKPSNTNKYSPNYNRFKIHTKASNN